MAALQLVGIEELFTPAWEHRLQAFKPARRMRRKPPVLTVALIPTRQLV